jgi:ATP-binding cassette subfamily C (CFTR/MRP) protein 1
VSSPNISPHYVQFTNFTANLPNVVSGLATFAAFSVKAHINGTEPLSTSQAFTSLALIILLTGPATQLLQYFPMIVATKACYDRIQKFLLTSNIEDGRISPTHDDTYGKESGIQSFPAVSVSNLHLDVPFHSSARAIKFSVPKGSIHMVSGPVGCGKSTLFKTLLGENKPKEGEINVQTTHISYCAQTPWLQNKSIKDNIIGVNIEDEIWYRQVIYTCNLNPDISQMPDGDDTQVGNRGLSISGGQKHRIVSFTHVVSTSLLTSIDVG